MIPSKNAVIRAANLLRREAGSSMICRAEMKRLNLEPMANEYGNQQHDFEQVAQYLSELSKNLGAAPAKKKGKK